MPFGKSTFGGGGYVVRTCEIKNDGLCVSIKRLLDSIKFGECGKLFQLSNLGKKQAIKWVRGHS